MSALRGRSRPPPLPEHTPGTTWTFRTVRPETGDVGIVHAWMNAPDVARFWQQDWSRPEWRRELDAQLAGTHSRPCLVERDGAPVAYLELYWAGEHAIGEHYTAPANDVGLHIAVAPTARGQGGAILTAATDGVFAALPGCTRMLAEPDARNTPAIRAFAKAGFRIVGEIELPHKRAALMARTADGAAAPVLRVPDQEGYEVG